MWSSKVRDHVARLRAHRSPLQAPPLEYQCSSGGNSSRTAKKKKYSILLQKDRVLLQTCAGQLHRDRVPMNRHTNITACNVLYRY